MLSGKEEMILSQIFEVLVHYRYDIVNRSKDKRKPVNNSV